jgi:glucosylglycerol-phosphate synthase
VEALRDDVEIEDAPVPRWMGATGQALSERRMPISVKVGSRRIHIDSLPIAVPADYIGEVASRPEVQQRSAQIVGDLGGGTRILSVGRVDYVKGIRQQLETYTRLLERRKDLHGRVRLLLVAAAAADGMTVYKAAQREIEQLVGHINGKFGRIDWSPITLSTRPMPFEEVVAAYCATEIAWITPLRDGMNLVAKEYVAARVDGDGLLVLSEFAGAAVELPEAILTNPYSLIQMDEAIERAIDMSEAERRRRMASMRQHVSQYDAAFWASTVLERFASLADWDVSLKT